MRGTFLTLLIPPLAGIVLLGWIANFYLLYQFIVSFKNKMPRTGWVKALGTGWQCTVGAMIFYFISRIDDKGGFGPRLIAAMYCFFGPAVWIVGFVVYRRLRGELESLSAAAFHQGPDVWPPPPTD